MSQLTLLDLIPAAASSSGKRPVSAWLIETLTMRGQLTETGLGRRAQVRRCLRCKASILTGLDDDRCALEAAVDPTPINSLGEVAVLMSGRMTWALHRQQGRWALDRREADQITTAPAGTGKREDVLPEHRCGSPALPEPLAAESTFPSATSYLPPNSPCPF